MSASDQSLCIACAISVSRFPSYFLSESVTKPTTSTPFGVAAMHRLSNEACSLVISALIFARVGAS